MASIADLRKMLPYLPADKAILLRGIHGIGKSEFVNDYYSKQGYKVISLFLGQISEAADLIGLPDRIEAEFVYNGQTIRQKITKFCAPDWWPRNENDKIVLFLDELNRSKPEVYNCVMDLVLNRKLNGLYLPKDTRIVAAINPLDDSYGYQVVDLDPALWDRFAVYDFTPTNKEWLNWAMEIVENKLRVNKYIISFLNKFGSRHLDPPANGALGTVYPSRRSWVHLSNIINQSSELITNKLDILSDIALGIIGDGATSSFNTFLKEQLKGIVPSKVVLGWDASVEKLVKKMSTPDHIVFNRELAMYLNESREDIFISTKSRDACAYNVFQYLQSIQKESVADFFDYVSAENIKHDESENNWARQLLQFQPIVNWFLDVYHGEEKEKSNYENIDTKDHFEDPDIEQLL